MVKGKICKKITHSREVREKKNLNKKFELDAIGKEITEGRK